MTGTLAVCLLSADIAARIALENRLSEPASGLELLFYVDYEKYDESSMPVSVGMTSSEGRPADLSARSSGDLYPAIPGVPRLPDKKDVGPTKIVQSIQSFGMALKKKGG